MMYVDSRLARLLATILTFSLVNLNVPYAAFRASADATAPTKPKVEPKKPMPASRLLAAKEMAELRGSIGANPYIAGSQRWDVVYKGVNVITGNYSTSATDLSFEGGYGIPANVTRSYSSNNPDEGPLGIGWTLSVDIRTTAGGLLKSPGSPSRSVASSFKERPVAQLDPTLGSNANQPVEAVLATDAAGTEQTIQRDVDGILTPPSWDLNTIEPTYESIVDSNGNVHQILVSQKVITPEGTTYEYSAHGDYGHYNGQDWVPGMDTGEPSNILKIDLVTDRHGNETTYTYGTTLVEFQKANGNVRENPLIGISMPGGHAITFTWAGNRITSATDNGSGSDQRTVVYSYDGGYLWTARSPGGKFTTYGYGSVPNCTGSYLNSITDARGLTTELAYAATNVCVPPYRYTGAPTYQVVSVSGILEPNGTTVDFDTPVDGFREYDANDTLTKDVWISASICGSSYQVNCHDEFMHLSGSTYGYGTPWSATYSISTQNLLERGTRTYPNDQRFIRANRWSDETQTYQYVITQSQYNFLGNPLVTRTYTEESLYYDIWKNETSYAYWGSDKYFQKKGTRVKYADGTSNIVQYSYTDYYDSSAASGSKGQTYKVFDSKFGTLALNTNIVPPTGTPTDDYWRYQLEPQSTDAYSGSFIYDGQGRSLSVTKLKSADPLVRVETVSTYGSDGSPMWGNATSVCEDYGTGRINRFTTNSAFNGAGKATITTNAAGRTFQTQYNLDGQVESVVRTDTNPDRPIVTYTYGVDPGTVTNGQVLTVTDELSSVEQQITYLTSGPGIGQVGTVTETGVAGTYVNSYSYNDAGLREMATYDTPKGTSIWGYSDYTQVGDPLGSSSVFQTLTKLEIVEGEEVSTPEEFHYLYDTAGRLRKTAFGQTKYNDDPLTNGHYYVTKRANSRAVATNTYDMWGRLQEIRHDWEIYGTNQQMVSSTPLCGQDYAYNDIDQRKQGRFYEGDSNGNMVLVRTEKYAYEPATGYLIGASYNNETSWDRWQYDAAGNRSKEHLNGPENPQTWSSYSYDNLNRLTSTPWYGSYGNDILGNRTNDQWVGHVWDELNRMVALNNTDGQVVYAYRADGLRVMKQYPSAMEALMSGGLDDGEGTDAVSPRPSYLDHRTLYRYDGQMCMEEAVDNQGVAVSLTRYGLGARGIDYIEAQQGTGAFVKSFPIYDGHGNMIATLQRAANQTCTTSNKRYYDVWGQIRSGAPAGQPSPRYCANLGHIQDDESGLVYMQARYYEPWTGRFISEDPASNGLNWFVYCSNNPVDRVDADGKEDLNAYFGDILLHMGLAASLAAAALMLLGGKWNCVQAIGASAFAVLCFALYFEARSSFSFGATIVNFYMMGPTMNAMVKWAVAVARGPSKGGRGHAAAAIAATYAYCLVLWGAMLAIDGLESSLNASGEDK